MPFGKPFGKRGVKPDAIQIDHRNFWVSDENKVGGKLPQKP